MCKPTHWIFTCIAFLPLLWRAEGAPTTIEGIYAVRMSTGEVLLDQMSDQSFVPSSCMKITTTGAALHLLGPNLRFETHLEYDGSIANGKLLRGNLYIRGGGDPCLGSDRIAGVLPWEKQLETWANAIEQLGIKQIEGSVIGDATCWEKALSVPSWSWEDLGNYYGAGACGLTFHENFYTLVFSPGKKVGEKTKVLRTDPPELAHTFQNEVITGPEGSGDRACVYGAEYFPTQFVRGTIPEAVKEFSIKGAIPDPAAWCTKLLCGKLQRRGIFIGNKSIAPKESRTLIHTNLSPTVGEIVHYTNQKSINLYAEHLLKKMGEVDSKEGSTDAGVLAVTTFWKSQGLNLDGFHMADGSGLSRKNRVTPKELVQMLLLMKKSAYFSIFYDSLPKRGIVRAKTGSMSFVRALAGYEGDIAFAILINGCCDQKELNQKMNSALALLDKARELE